jgi:hypothetical protein
MTRDIDGKVYWLPERGKGMPRIRRRRVEVLDTSVNGKNEVIAVKIKLRLRSCWVPVSEINPPKTGVERRRKRKKGHVESVKLIAGGVEQES